jgi:hypothetical protein
MRIAQSYTDLAASDLPARSLRSPFAFRVVGLLIAVVVPTAFWVLALQVVSKVGGFTTSAPALTTFGLVIAACCFVGAAVVMSGRH